MSSQKNFKLGRVRKSILEFLISYSDSGVHFNKSPTYEEIALNLGLYSPTHVKFHLIKLEEHGYISRKKNKFRSIKISKSVDGKPIENKRVFRKGNILLTGEPYALLDRQWEIIWPMLNNRRFISEKAARSRVNSILWILSTGNAWNDLPQKYGNHESAYTLFKKWQKMGFGMLFLKRLAKFQSKTEERHQNISIQSIYRK